MTPASPVNNNNAKRAWFRLPWMLWAYRVGAAILLLTAAYFATYQLFFQSLPLENYAKKVEGGTAEPYNYEGVVYFFGRKLAAGESITMEYGSVRVLDSADGKGVELYVRIDVLPQGASPDEVIGTLHVESYVRDEIVDSADVPLYAQKLQRHFAPWKTEAGKRNSYVIRYTPAENSAIENTSPPHPVVATNIVGVHYWGRIMFFTLLGGACVFMLTFAQRFRNLQLLGVIAISLTVMCVLHSGAFISNEFVEETEDSILSTYGDAWTWFGEGTWNPAQYRSTGYMLIPAATFVIEGLDASKDRHFMLSTLPTPRFLMFAWFAVSLPLLITAIYKHIHRTVSVIFGILAALFFPFIIDLYNICDDAYAIPLFTVFMAAFITYAYDKSAARREAAQAGEKKTRKIWGPVIVMVVVFFIMMTAKVTAAYLLILAPLGLWVQATRERKKLFSIHLGPAMLFILMFAAMFAGRTIAGVGERYVRPGYPWASGTLPEIIWAANGLYDEHSAFWFTKRGSTRTERIVEQTGLPDTMMIRHSQAANDLVYKPQVINAVKERPGYFYSTAMFRAYADGLGFWRYRYGGSQRWDKWMKDGRGKQVEISGEKVYVLKHERQLIRYGKMWKVSALVLWAKLIQDQLSMGMDIVLLGWAVLGIFLIRRWDMGILLLGCFAAKMVFNNFIHALVRYMDFNHVGLLIGLAVAMYCLWLGLKLSANKSFWRHALDQPKRP